MKRKQVAILLVVVMLLSLFGIQGDFVSKAKSKTHKYNITIYSGAYSSFSIPDVKSTDSAKLSSKSNNKTIAYAKCSGKKYYTIYGKKIGRTKVTVTLKVKYGKKKKTHTYKYIYSVTVIKNESAITPTPSPTVKPDYTSSPSQSFDYSVAKAKLKVEKYIQTDDFLIYKFTNDYSLPMYYNLKICAYEGDLLVYNTYLSGDEAYESDLFIGPGQTRYVELRSGIEYYKRFTIKQDVIVNPVDNHDMYQPAKDSQLSITHGKVDGDVVINGACNEKGYSINYTYLVLVYRDGIPFCVKYAFGGAGYGNVDICRVMLDFDSEDTAGHTMTYELLPSVTKIYKMDN